MIHDLKRTFKLLQFSYHMKGNFFLGIGFTLGGLLLVLCVGADTVWGRYAGLLALVGSFFPMQMMYSLAVAETVLVSPLRKTLLTKAAILCNFIFQVAIYCVVALIRGIQGMSNPVAVPFASEELLVLAYFGAILTLYGVLALKFFWIPTILFCFCYPSISTVLQMDLGAVEAGTLSFGMAVVVGLVIMAVGAVLGYVVSLLIYKKPVSKMSQTASLRQYM